MGKASSPIRLERGLMDAAKTTGALSHRSSAEQIEYWADLGRKVSHVLSPDVILALKAGFATLSVEQVKAPELDVDDVFAGLKRDREDGTLSGKISAGNVRYQASKLILVCLSAFHLMAMLKSVNSPMAILKS